MCGIFGLLSPGGIGSSPLQARRLLESFYLLSESRGKEASGAALIGDDQIDVVKAPIRGKDFLGIKAAKVISDGFVDALESARPVVLIGHTRMVTNGADHVHGNNQPVVASGLVAIHNGIIVNDDALWSLVPDQVRQHAVDTEVMLALSERHIGEGMDLASACAAAMRELKGANTFAVLSSRHDGLVLCTSNGSMFVARENTSGLVVFASERSILERIITTCLQPFVAMPITAIRHLAPGELAALPFDGSVPTVVQWRAPTSPMPINTRPAARTIVDHDTSSIKSASTTSVVNRTRQREIERLAEVDWSRIRALTRCSRCVLPETFPFIRFDTAGVCNFCNSHRPYPLKGVVKLREELDQTRRSDGRPEILFPISGGRDSCYGLHVIVNEFGIKPVAYTYDWGMVTDLARRNISRMCGQLGIEHVLISADITRKRHYIHQNVAAWLRKPHLGTVPLFMAGDKQFFYYASMLRKEMGLARTLFSMNPLERTDFKVGFCGIDESYHKDRHYDPSLTNKLRLGAFYAGQFLTNAGFINTSLLDSAFAYFSYYLIPKDFTSMFDYLPWREGEVETVLLQKYDWEVSSDTKSTWRIGDGTAAFYNYIYLRVAGFSENDTFRSNQIREGLIARDDAMTRIYADNRPRIESIAWYFDTIGLDAVEAVKTINAMPTRY